MKRIWKYGLLVLGLLTATITVRQLNAQPSQGVFYRVSGGKGDVYLLGSIHIGTKDMYPMAKEIRDAIEQADFIVFECDSTDYQAQEISVAMMKSEVPLYERVSLECYEKTKQAAEKLGYSMDALEYLDPWAITSMMTVSAASKELNGSRKSVSALGVENAVRKAIKHQQVLYLETVEEQLAIMEAFSPALQEYLLTDACDTVLGNNANTEEQSVSQWPLWWKEGNVEAFAQSYLQELENEISSDLAREYHDSMVRKRNIQMTEKIQNMLENTEGKKHVVVVGLMHLVLEDDSIVALLREKGYTVELIDW